MKLDICDKCGYCDRDVSPNLRTPPHVSVFQMKMGPEPYDSKDEYFCKDCGKQILDFIKTMEPVEEVPLTWWQRVTRKMW